MAYYIKFQNHTIAYIWGSPAYAQEMLNQYISELENENLYLEVV